MDRFPARQVDLSEVMAELFKSLAHSVRVRVLELLAAAEGTVPVSDLLASTGWKPPTCPSTYLCCAAIIW
ncbi:hypothetical protein ABFP37_18865 [Burkholderia sp. RS01]|uniref:hypothetical protein n=1 Tax=Bacteria TaxID=2 RepID=UPI0026B04095|nr:hypothetical protein [Arthrobacter sp. KBS0703]